MFSVRLISARGGSVRASTLSTPNTRIFSRSASALSAIQRGLRESERAQPRGNAPSTLRSDARNARRAIAVSERGRVRPKLDAPLSTFKIRKGKKDISEPPKPKRQSRKARFNDPSSSFGKKSLVYQLKSGQLQNSLAALERKDTKSDANWGSPSAFGQSTRPGPSQSSDPFGALLSASQESNGRASERDARLGGRRREAPRAWGPDPRSSTPRRDPRPDFRPDPRPDPRPDHRPDPRPDSRLARPSLGSRGRTVLPSRPSAAIRSATFREDRFGAERRTREQDRGADDGENPWPSSAFSRPRRPAAGPPASIPYTTAASQFLYGKSVVEEALRARRRRLYNLYIYRGANRLNVGQDKVIENLAKKAGVKITFMGEQDQKLLSKMSAGRPHNGYILEASPVPQRPVTALGPFSENAGPRKGKGFSVSLAYQSAEDAAVNGKGDFVQTRPGGYKPLVLMLDEILDPGNLGAMLRTASFLGISAVAISKKHSSALTSVALKASVGASETLALFSVENTATFLAESRENGWKVFAAVAPPQNRSSRRRNQMDTFEVEDSDPLRSDPCILVLGSEGEGLPRMIRSKSDVEVSIPNEAADPSSVDSLNVSVAAGLLCSAFMKGQTRANNPVILREPLRSSEMGIWE